MKKNKIQSLPKGVSQEFLDNINTMSTDQLKAEIVTLQLQNDENEEFKSTEGYLEAEEEFQTAKDRYGLVVGPVKELTIGIKNRTKEVIKRLKEKGGA